jgi:hypothetical protein
MAAAERVGQGWVAGDDGSPPFHMAPQSAMTAPGGRPATCDRQRIPHFPLLFFSEFLETNPNP